MVARVKRQVAALEVAHQQAATLEMPGYSFTEGVNEPVQRRRLTRLGPSQAPARVWVEVNRLTQLYSLRYGTVPIVRGIGGLADTVIDESASAAGTGFVFNAATALALKETLLRALTVYRQKPQRWQALMRKGMAQEVSWAGPAQAYHDLYARLLVGPNSFGH